jgi:dihydrofolate synthase / folylpolyglutamate synthase
VPGNFVFKNKNYMSTYKQTTSELFDLQKYAIKLGLDNITALASFYNNPQNNFSSIHIAGTNGKGSTAFYIAQILRACGLKVGLFTSPHLYDFRERIRINDTLIEESFIIDFWRDIKEKVHNLKATFFDTTTLMAFTYFSDGKVDVAIIETGLGGRLDSTNILQPESVVLTPIGFDHQKQLGNDLISIAGEKAGIIKKGADVFIASQKKNVKDFLVSRCRQANTVFLLDEYFQTKITGQEITRFSFKLKDKISKKEALFNVPTPATYQAENIALAYLTAQNYCHTKKIDFDTGKIKSLIAKSSWPGRMQVIQTKPTIIFDVSHNLEGIVKTLQTLFKTINPKKTDLLLGIVNDKDARAICDFIGNKFRNVIVTEPSTVRKQDGILLVRMLEGKNQSVKFIKDLQTAYEVGKDNLKNDDTLLALGSHYLIGSLNIG